MRTVRSMIFQIYKLSVNQVIDRSIIQDTDGQGMLKGIGLA